jgi:nitrite reductase (NO-forming)
MLTSLNRRKFIASMAFIGTSAVPISLAITRAQETPTPMASPGASPVASPMASPVTALTIDAFDIGYSVTEFTIPANTDATVTIRNTGVMPHTFYVNEHNQFPNVPNLDIDVDIDPGQTGMTTINAPAGDYYYWCAVPGHEAAGMHGVMHVQ